MNPIPELTPLLKRLRLSGLADTLEQRNREAIERKLAYTDFLTLLIQDEVARRDQKKLDLGPILLSSQPTKTKDKLNRRMARIQGLQRPDRGP